MKKIFLIILIASGAWATQVSVAKITGTTWGATDTSVASGNYTGDSSVAMGAFFMPSGQTYTLSAAGYYLTLGNGGIVWKDSSSGTKTYFDSVFITGNGSVKISSGSGAVTATSTAWRYNGVDTLNDNKSITSKALYIGNSLTVNGLTSTFTNADICLTMYDNANLSITTGNIRPTRSNPGNLYSLPETYTIAGAGSLTLRNSSAGKVTLPALTAGGTITLSIQELANSNNDSITGNISAPTIEMLVVGASRTCVINTGIANITASTLFRNGSSNAAGSLTWNAGSGTHTFASYTGATYNTGTSNDNLQTSQISCSGSWTFGSNHVVTGTAATQSVTFTGAGTTTSNEKTFPGNVVINSSGVLRTFADKFRCDGNFTATAGKITFASLARDSIAGSYVNALTGTDTLNRNSDSLWVGASFTGNLRIKNDLSRTYLYGTALCNFTSNGTVVNYFDIRGTDRTKQQKLIDRYHGRKQVITTGTFNTNDQDVFCDSFFICNDSIATVLGDTISSQKITFGTSATPSLTVPLQLFFGLALKDTLFDTCPRSLGKLTVNKSGDTLTLSGVTHLDTLQVVDGGLRMRSATDTVYCRGMSWTSTDLSTIIAPIIVTDSIYIAAGASITYSGVGRIQTLTCKLAAGGNAAKISYLPIGPVSYAGSPYTWYVGTALTPIAPTTTCGIIDSVVAATAWPGGMSIARATGIITGTPTTPMSASGYKVYFWSWSYGAAYKDSATVTITVSASITKRRISRNFFKQEN